MDDLSSFVDATAVAAQLGRLDLASLLLAAVGLVLVAGGVYAFINFRGLAREQAKSEASKIAAEVAERIANEHMQRELPNIIRAYQTIIVGGGETDEEADSVAKVQEKGEGD